MSFFDPKKNRLGEDRKIKLRYVYTLDENRQHGLGIQRKMIN